MPTTSFFEKERDYFVENLSVLISGGMPILRALEVIAGELRSGYMKNVVAAMAADIEAGFPLWRAIDKANLFPQHVISLIRLGEGSGNLIENLRVVAVEQEKNRLFRSKLASAMIYPVFVFLLTLIVGIGTAWFVLPKLALVFTQLHIRLPLITKIFISAGTFLGTYGYYVVPATIAFIFLLFFFIFSFSKTKFIGQFFLFSLPGVGRLIREVEVARFGYFLGTLLHAGLPITQALNALAGATEVVYYRRLYLYLSDSVGDGNSFQKSFATFKDAKRLIPVPIEQLIVVAEQSGSLESTFLTIGRIFEEKIDITAKNLAIILEPVLLVIVWFGVMFVAVAIITPIYGLISNFN